MKHGKKKNNAAMRLSLAGLICGAASCVIAQPTAAGAGEESFFEPLPLVLTVSRMSRPQNEAPAAMTVLDSELIRATGYRDLDRLLRLVPGMLVAKGRGSEQWVSYHGPNATNPQQLQILVDGRSVTATYFGGFGTGALPLAIEDIERIEIVRGTDAASYGTNAFMGVVNIITRHTAEESGASVLLAGGTGNFREASARYASHTGPLGLRLTAQHLSDEGVDDLHDSRRRARLSVRGDLQLGPNDELTLLAGTSDSERGTGFADTPFNSNPQRDIDTHEHFAHLRWRRALAADEEFALAAYLSYERTRNEWAVDSGPLSPVIGPMTIPVNDSYTSRRYNLEFQHQFVPRDGLRLAWGAEWRHDTLHAPFLFFGEATQFEKSRRIFANVEWRPSPAWLWNFGAMAEHFESDRTRLSPRLFLNWLPDDDHGWRAGYARAWRHPGPFSRSSDVRIFAPAGSPLGGLLLQHRFVPNPDIDPSRLDSVELGYAGRFPRWQANLDVRVFHERITDQIERRTADDPLPQIVPQSVLPSSQWGNIAGTLHLEGVETQFDFKPWRDGTLLLRHARMRARGGDQDLRDSIAPYSASLTWLQRMGAWQGSLSLLRVGPRRIGVGFAPGFRYTVDDYTTLDASLAREFRLARGEKLTLRVTAQNLLGRHHELTDYPVQQAAGDKPVNRLQPQLFISVLTRF